MSFMAESVPQGRSHLHFLRFLFLIAVGMALAALQPTGITLRVFSTVLIITSLVSAVIYCTERYGNVSDEVKIAVSIVVLAVLAVVIWRHQTHKPDINTPYIPNSQQHRSN